MLDSDGIYYVVPVWRPLYCGAAVCMCRFIDLLVHKEFLYQNLMTMPTE